MTLTRKDAVATGFTGLAVLAFVATHEAWNVPLVGDSHRWAAAVIMAPGYRSMLGGRQAGQLGAVRRSRWGRVRVWRAGAGHRFADCALALVADMVVMWALTTLRHAHSPPGRPVTT